MSWICRVLSLVCSLSERSPVVLLERVAETFEGGSAIETRSGSCVQENHPVRRKMSVADLDSVFPFSQFPGLAAHFLRALKIIP
jgi:hypothetical protein